MEICVLNDQIAELKRQLLQQKKDADAIIESLRGQLRPALDEIEMLKASLRLAQKRQVSPHVQDRVVSIVVCDLWCGCRK